MCVCVNPAAVAERDNNSTRGRSVYCCQCRRGGGERERERERERMGELSGES